MADRWIVIPKWDDFQHYTDGRRLKWIKNWSNLMDNDDYLALNFHQRGVLHGLWIAYAAAEGQLLGSTSTLYRHLGQRVSTATLEALNHAGFIRFSGTKPSRIRTLRSREEEKVLREAKGKPTGTLFALQTLIANGVIRDNVDLDVELRSGDHRITDEQRAQLVALLPTDQEAA